MNAKCEEGEIGNFKLCSRPPPTPRQSRMTTFDVTPMGGNNQEKSLEQLSMDYTECETLLDSVENNQQ